MKRHNRHQRKYKSIPEKPELEITSSSYSEIDETVVPGETTQEFYFEREGTSYETTEEIAYTAPVRMPPREKLALNMVPSDLVYRYDEYRSEESLVSAWFFAFIGAFLGVVINWATSEPLEISKASIIIELVIFIIILVLGSLAYRFKKRARNEKSKIDDLGNR